MSSPDLAERTVDLDDPQYYFNRELSWLRFNERVLHEAFDQRTPLLERLKFLAIFSSNLDEFFMVRVAGIMEQIQAGVHPKNPDGLTPRQQLAAIREHLADQVRQQHQLFEYELRPALMEHGVCLVAYEQLSRPQQRYLKDFFERHIFPVLTPLSVDPAHPFPRMSNLSLNLAVRVADPETGVEKFARVKVPNSLSRFVGLPEDLSEYQGEACLWLGVPLEQVIAENLDYLFPGMDIRGSHVFRITRDADFTVREDEGDDLLLAIEQEISKRRLEGSVCRLEIRDSMPIDLRQGIQQELRVSDSEIYEVEGLLDLGDLFFFMSLPLPELKDPPWKSTTPARLRPVVEFESDDRTAVTEHAPDIFAVLREGDVMIHHPYESFPDSVAEFIAQAARDPQVLAIKITLYRTSGDSPIVKSLIRAAENRKQVVALVELKARFDEENNIVWAKQLEDAGVHVVYGVVGLKTHTKTMLLVREEGDQIRRYVHIGTGNYNPKTAKLYTDLSLLSCREDLGADLTDLFNFLTGFSRQKQFRQLLVAPATLRDRLLALIQQEIDHAQAGRNGRIIAKMNALVDAEMIKALYRASQAGVQIELIVRGICCLRPGVEGLSENIHVISVIGRFLEHSRIFYFQSDGAEKYYIGSADWMPRNLNRRVEAVAPIADPGLKDELRAILQIMLDDNRQAWDLQPDGRFIQRHPKGDQPERGTHHLLMQRSRLRDQ